MKTKLYTLLSVVTLALAVLGSCKKNEFDVNDPKAYTWKRMLYRQAFTKPDEIPSANKNDYDRVLIATDMVKLTGAQVKYQQDSIWKASAKVFSYEYTKVR